EGIRRCLCLAVPALVPGDAAPAIAEGAYLRVELRMVHEQAVGEHEHRLTCAGVLVVQALTVDVGMGHGGHRIVHLRVRPFKIDACRPTTGAMGVRHLSVVLAAVAALALAPASALATSPLKGTVSGTPYVVDASRTAVPVLLTRQTARAARLKSIVGIVLLNRRKPVAAAGGSPVLPGRLRLGDRFT